MNRLASLFTHRRAVGLQYLLTSLALLVVVPLLLYAAVLLYLMAQEAQAGTTRELRAASRALAAFFEGAVSQSERMLSLMAQSPALDEREVDVESMVPLMQRVSELGIGLYSFTALDREGRVVARFPPLPQPRPPLQRELTADQEEVFRTGLPVLSDVHASPVDGVPSISLNVPVRRDGRVPYVIASRIDPIHLSWLLASQTAQRGAIATVLDRDRNIVARSRGHDRYFGLQPSAQTLEALATGPTGAQRFATLDDKELLWAWTTLSSGWVVLIGTPANLADQALRASMLRLAAAGLLALALGIGLTAFVARRIVRSVDTMTANAPRLAAGERLDYEPSGIRQLDALYRALDEASSRLVAADRQRAEALEAEQAARAIADSHNRAKDVFIATLAHELRNPLAPIRNAARVLQAPNIDDARRRWATEVIDRQVRSMARLLDDLLDISRINSGRIRLDPAPVTVASVLEAAIEVARPLIDSRGHELAARRPPKDLTVDGDALRLSQVFSNLLTNAAKYTDPGGRIEIDARRGDGEVVVSVRDNGIGIDPSAVDKVFDVFSQVHSPLDRSQGGLGIGLALVRGLVQLHGGWVSAASEGLGRGSEFRVGLPLTQQRPQVCGPRSRAARADPERPLCVIVAEENPDSAQSVEIALRLEGHETHVAHGGRDALQLAMALQPDVACIDVGMQDVDGYEVARRLRATDWGARAKLVALNAWDTPDDDQRAREAGFDAHLGKPVNLQALLRLLKGYAAAA